MLPNVCVVVDGTINSGVVGLVHQRMVKTLKKRCGTSLGNKERLSNSLSDPRCRISTMVLLSYDFESLYNLRASKEVVDWLPYIEGKLVGIVIGDRVDKSLTDFYTFEVLDAITMFPRLDKILEEDLANGKKEKSNKQVPTV